MIYIFHSDDKLVKVWDWERGEAENTLVGHLNEVITDEITYCTYHIKFIDVLYQSD